MIDRASRPLQCSIMQCRFMRMRFYLAVSTFCCLCCLTLTLTLTLTRQPFFPRVVQASVGARSGACTNYWSLSLRQLFSCTVFAVFHRRIPLSPWPCDMFSGNIPRDCLHIPSPFSFGVKRKPCKKNKLGSDCIPLASLIYFRDYFLVGSGTHVCVKQR